MKSTPAISLSTMETLLPREFQWSTLFCISCLLCRCHDALRSVTESLLKQTWPWLQFLRCWLTASWWWSFSSFQRQNSSSFWTMPACYIRKGVLSEKKRLWGKAEEKQQHTFMRKGQLVPSKLNDWWVRCLLLTDSDPGLTPSGLCGVSTFCVLSKHTVTAQ